MAFASSSLHSSSAVAAWPDARAVRLFRSGQVVRILGVSRRQLQYWAETDLVAPSARTRGGHHRYTFEDLVALRAAKQLIDAGVSVQRIRHSIGSLKRILPEVQKPLSELVLVATGDLVLVLHGGSTFEAVSGQEWIFEVSRAPTRSRAGTGARSGGAPGLLNADRSTELRKRPPANAGSTAQSAVGPGVGGTMNRDATTDPIVTRIIAIVNQKGGCAKTTTAVNLAGCLALDGARVLVVDLDPQAHASIALGVDPEALDENLYEVLAEEEGVPRLADVIVPAGERLHVAPSGIVLSALEQKLAQERAETRTDRLARAIAALPDPYDYVLVDCPPNVGLLTFNALRAAHEVIVPVETSHFALHGVHKLLETIALLAERLRIAPDVRILATLYDGRTRFARETLAEIRTRFGDACFDTVIRNSVKLREAARRGLPVVRMAPSSNGAADYAALAPKWPRTRRRRQKYRSRRGPPRRSRARW